MSVSRSILKNQNPIFGQLVIGPPGSGKTTYCHKMSEFLSRIDRNVAVINLDPANDHMNYKPDIDIMDLITVEDVMEHIKLGPNGALMYCIEHLEANFSWLFNKLNSSTCTYFIFDCPGQIELYTHHDSMSKIFNRLEQLGYHLCTVNLIDSHYCSEPTKFISTVMMSLSMMLKMGLPHVNILSKADLLQKNKSKLAFNLDFYTEVLDLQYLLDALDNTKGFAKYSKLNAAIVGIIEDFSLVSFQPLNVFVNESLLRLKNMIDKANGYCYGAGEEKSINSLLACAVGAETEAKRARNDLDPYV